MASGDAAFLAEKSPARRREADPGQHLRLARLAVGLIHLASSRYSGRQRGRLRLTPSHAHAGFLSSLVASCRIVQPPTQRGSLQSPTTMHPMRTGVAITETAEGQNSSSWHPWRVCLYDSATPPLRTRPGALPRIDAAFGSALAKALIWTLR